MKTLVNTTPGEFILVAIPTLWNKLQAHAYQEAKQIATNRLSERVKLTLDEADIRTYLGHRFPKAEAADLKVAARIIRPNALLAGNYAFLRDVARMLSGVGSEEVSRAVGAVTGRR